MIPHVPLVLVYGPNGSGKTRVIGDALVRHPHVDAERAPDDYEMALAWCVDDLLYNPEILADVASLYSSLSLPLTLTLAPASARYLTPHVAPPNHPERAEPLAHSGGGLARLLFTATRATAAVHRGRIHGIDHPERDLDGHNRAAFACYLARLAARPGARLVIETNEQTFALAAQLAVAKGEIPAESVRLVQIERSANDRITAQEITLTPWGALSDGAVNPNRADYRLACDLAVAARHHPDRPRAVWETPKP